MDSIPAIVTQGSPPVLGNLFVMFWAILKFLMPIAILILVIWYLRNQNEYRKQLLYKQDSLISVLQTKKDDE